MNARKERAVAMDGKSLRSGVVKNLRQQKVCADGDDPLTSRSVEKSAAIDHSEAQKSNCYRDGRSQTSFSLVPIATVSAEPLCCRADYCRFH